MRNMLLAAAALASLAAAPTLANAQANTVGGVATGAVIGGVVAGPPGAVAGGLIGGTVGANTERSYVRDDRYWVEPQPRAATRSCWRDDFGRRICGYR